MKNLGWLVPSDDLRNQVSVVVPLKRRTIYGLMVLRVCHLGDKTTVSTRSASHRPAWSVGTPRSRSSRAPGVKKLPPGEYLWCRGYDTTSGTVGALPNST